MCRKGRRRPEFLRNLVADNNGIGGNKPRRGVNKKNLRNKVGTVARRQKSENH